MGIELKVGPFRERLFIQFSLWLGFGGADWKCALGTSSCRALGSQPWIIPKFSQVWCCHYSLRDIAGYDHLSVVLAPLLPLFLPLCFVGSFLDVIVFDLKESTS